jgi:hypothetical protein
MQSKYNKFKEEKVTDINPLNCPIFSVIRPKDL